MSNITLVPADLIQKNQLQRVVDAEQVEFNARNGWRVVAMFTKRMPVSVSNAQYYGSVQACGPAYGTGPAYGNSVPYIASSTAEYVDATMFLMVLDEDSTVAKLHRESDDIRRAFNESDTARKKLTEENKKLAEEAVRAKELAESLRIRAEASNKQCYELLVVKQRMEKDLGAVRRAIGEREMKRILDKGTDG